MLSEAQSGQVILFVLYMIWFRPSHRFMVWLIILLLIVGKIGEITGIMIYSALVYILTNSVLKCSNVKTT